MISRSRQHPIAICVPLDGHDCIFMIMPAHKYESIRHCVLCMCVIISAQIILIYKRNLINFLCGMWHVLLCMGVVHCGVILSETYNVAKHWPLLASHILTGCCESRLPETSRAFVGCQSTHLTSDPWPRKIRSSWHLMKSHTRTVPSSLAVANFVSPGQKLWIQIRIRQSGIASRGTAFMTKQNRAWPSVKSTHSLNNPSPRIPHPPTAHLFTATTLTL